MDRDVIVQFADELARAAEESIALRNGDTAKTKPQLGETGAVGTTVFGGVVDDPFESVAEWGDARRYHTIRNMVFGDAKVHQTHQALMLPLRQAQWGLTPDPENDEIANAVHRAMFVSMKRSFRDVIYDATMAPRWGNAILEMAWRFDEKERRFVWDDWALRLPWTIKEWNSDSKGRLVDIVQEYTEPDGGLVEKRLKRDQFLLFNYERIGGDHRGTPLARFMWKHYRLKGGLEKIDAVASERNAMGVPKWMLPRILGTGDEGRAETIVENVRTHERGGVVVPHGHDFSIEGVAGTIRETVPSIRYHAEEISGTASAGHQDLGKTQSGARALAEPQLDMFQLVLLGQALAMCEVMTREAVVPFVNHNFGPQETYPQVTCSLLTNRKLDAWLASISQAKEKGAFGPWSPADEAFVRKEAALPEVDEAQRRKEEQELARQEKAEADKLEKMRPENSQSSGEGEGGGSRPPAPSPPSEKRGA